MTRKIIATFDAEDGPFLRKTNKLVNEVTRLERTTNAGLSKIDNRFARTGRTVSRFAQVFAGAFSARLVTDYSDRAKRIRRSLQDMGQEGQRQFDLLFAKSVESRSGMVAFTATVQDMYKAVADRQSFEATVEQVSTLNKLLATSGRSLAQRNSTLTQLGQALQSGVLQGDELRSLRENAPVELLDAIAEAAGGTRAELRELGADGALTTDVILEAVDRLAGVAETKLAGMSKDFAEAVQDFENAAIVSVEAFDKTLGASDAAVAGIQRLAAAMTPEAAERFAQSLQVGAAILGTTYAARNLNGIVDGLKRQAAARRENVTATQQQIAVAREEVRQARRKLDVANRNQRAAAQRARTASQMVRVSQRQVAAANALAAAEMNAKRAVDAHTAAQVRLSLAARASVAATNLLRGALAFFGGVPGLILTGVAALTVFSATAKTAAERVDDALATLDGLPDKYRGVVGQIKTDLERLEELHAQITKAIETQGSAAADTAAIERQAINERLAKNRELAKSMLAVAVVARQQAEEGVQDLRDQLFFDFSGGMRLGDVFAPFTTPEERDRRMREGRAEDYAAFEAEVDRKIAANEDLLRSEQEFVERRAELLERERALDAALSEETILRVAAGEAEADALGGRAEAAERSADQLTVAEEAAQRALEERQGKILETYAAGIQKLEELAQAKRDAEAGLAAAVKAEDASLVATWREALANIDAAIDGTRVRVAGSHDTVVNLHAAVVAALEEMRDVPFDENENARANLEELEQRLQEAIDAGHDLDNVSLQALVSEVDRATGATYTLGDAMASAAADARRLSVAAETALARQRIVSSVSDPVARAGALAGFDFDTRVDVPTDAPDGFLADIQRERERSVQAAREMEQLRIQEQQRLAELRAANRPSRRSGGGRTGGRRQAETDAQKRLNDAERIYQGLIRETQTDEERRAARAREIADARKVLVETYGEEHEMVQRLDEATKRLENTGAQTFARLTNSLAQAVARGDDLGDVLESLLLQLIEMNGVAAFQSLFSGGGLGGFVSALFGFASGGVMTSGGPLPLKTYARGGIANSPQVAVYGEGKLPEAYVPLPDGRTIPVTLNMPDLKQLGSPQVSPAMMGGMAVDASLHIAVDGSDMTADDVTRIMRPELQKHQQDTIRKIGQISTKNPGYLHT